MSKHEVKIKIDGKEYTVQEARALYNELHELFGRADSLPYLPTAPSPFEPIGPGIAPTSPWATYDLRGVTTSP